MQKFFSKLQFSSYLILSPSVRVSAKKNVMAPTASAKLKNVITAVFDFFFFEFLKIYPVIRFFKKTLFNQNRYSRHKEVTLPANSSY